MQGFFKAIGKELRNIRQDKDISLKEVAEQAGVSSMYISEIEREKKVPSDELIFKLAEIYKINAMTLFEGFGRIPEDMQKEVVEHPELFYVLYKLKDLPNDKKNEFYEELRKLYNKHFTS